MIDDIFILNNTNTIVSTDKVNMYPLPNHYKIGLVLELIKQEQL